MTRATVCDLCGSDSKRVDIDEKHDEEYVSCGRCGYDWFRDVDEDDVHAPPMTRRAGGDNVSMNKAEQDALNALWDAAKERSDATRSLYRLYYEQSDDARDVATRSLYRLYEELGDIARLSAKAGTTSHWDMVLHRLADVLADRQTVEHVKQARDTQVRAIAAERAHALAGTEE